MAVVPRDLSAFSLNQGLVKRSHAQDWWLGSIPAVLGTLAARREPSFQTHGAQRRDGGRPELDRARPGALRPLPLPRGAPVGHAGNAPESTEAAGRRGREARPWARAPPGGLGCRGASGREATEEAVEGQGRPVPLGKTLQGTLRAELVKRKETKQNAAPCLCRMV